MYNESLNSPADRSTGPESASGRVVIIDEDADVRRILRKLLTDSKYGVEEFREAEPGLARIREAPPDLILMDLRQPDRDGHEVLEEIRSDPRTRLLPVVMLTESATPDDKIRALGAGVTDFVAKPFSLEELLPRIRSLVILKQFADEHEHAEHVILTLARTIDARDPHTSGHSGRVAELADRVAQRIGLAASARSDMRRGALFHDLGRIVVPDAILHKPGKLTDEERRIVEEHPVVGRELLAPMLTMARSLPIVYSHHERLDGSGYPEGISGDAIPIAVRIVTICDAYDALTHDRSYREALSVALALEVLEEGVRKSWWDRDAVRVLRALTEESVLPGHQA
jgi:putative two-component system response regulator